ncbi:MAG: hypothetical protein CMC93_03200 [Flavobacteriaceae bacterium]|nr:hypothetical protein [Flavobacteriaceae bacterium]|tara:strand:+ start:1198 stop:1656 length:459 start_codon:yes stop_codon:yes gene_type:complete
MSKVKHYLLDEISEDDFHLMAIHTRCEGYLLAYLLNKYLSCKFKLSKNKTAFNFENYQWIDRINQIEVHLYSNRTYIEQNEKQNEIRLFDLPESKELYLVNDLKDADFIIKINSGVIPNIFIRKVESMEEISYCYLPDQRQLNHDFIVNLDG